MTKNILVTTDTLPQVDSDELITISGWAVIPYRPEDPPVTVEFYNVKSGLVVHEVSLLLGQDVYEVPKERLGDLDPDDVRMRIVTISGQSTEVHLTKETKKL